MASASIEAKGREGVLHVQDYLKALRSRWKQVAGVFLLIFLTSVVLTRITTPEYTSITSFSISQPGELVRYTAGGDVTPIELAEQPGPSWTETQYEILLSEKTLKVVVENLKLLSEWGVDEPTAINMLRGMTDVAPRTATNIVDVSVTHEDAHMAQKICAAIPEAYSEMRDRDEQGLLEEAVQVREQMLKKQEQVVQDKKDAIMSFIRQGKFPSLNLYGGNSSAPLYESAEYQSFNKLLSDRDTMESEIRQMSVHISKLHDLKDEALLSYVTRAGLLTAETFGTAKVRSLNEDYEKAKKTREEMIMNGYGERHPRVLAIDQNIETTKADLMVELVGMRDAMKEQLDVKQKEFEALGARLKKAESDLRLKQEDIQKVQSELQDLSEEVARRNKMRDDLKADRARLNTPRPSIKMYNTASLPLVPSKPNYTLNLAVGGALGLLAGIISALVSSYFDTSIKTLEDAEVQLGLPVLGVIPRDAGILMLQDQEGPDAEAYRILRTNIELKRSLYNATTFAVVSSNAGEGKSTTVCNLAYVCAQSGYSTLMIDADMRRPRLGRYAEVSSELGLSDYLSRDLELKDVVLRSSVPNLFILPSGAPPLDPSGLISSSRMDQLLVEARKRFDIVLFDSPPVLGVSDASLLVHKADATLLVLQPKRMPLKALLRAKTTIENAGGRLMGLVMNNVDISGDTQYQYYTTYYSYYRSEDRDGKSPSKDSASKKPAAPVASNAGAEEKNSNEDLY